MPASAQTETKRPRRRQADRDEPNGRDTKQAAAVPTPKQRQPTRKTGLIVGGPVTMSESEEPSVRAPRLEKQQKKGTKRVQWDDERKDRTGNTSTPFGREIDGTVDGRPDQTLKRAKTSEQPKTVGNERLPASTEGAPKRPRRVATPATAKKRPTPPAPPLASEAACKRFRAHGALDKALAWKTAKIAKPDLVRRAPVHGRPPDGNGKRARLRWGSSDLRKREEATVPMASTAPLG